MYILYYLYYYQQLYIHLIIFNWSIHILAIFVCRTANHEMFSRKLFHWPIVIPEGLALEKRIASSKICLIEQLSKPSRDIPIIMVG